MKEKIAKTFMSACVAAPAFAFGAALVPSVSDVTMSQAQDRTVTITYKLANAPAVVTLDIQTNTTDGTWVSIGGENISGVVSGVPKGDVWKVMEEDGQHTITWRPDRTAWVDSRVPANGARAVVTAWATNAAPDYMVFDLAATSSQRVSYFPSEEFLPGGLLTNPDYRTTRLVMRKIPANGAVFTRGSIEEFGREPKREMIHSATLDNDYYMGVFEVTQSQWMQIMGNNPSAFTNGVAMCAMRPVERVSYQAIRTTAGDDYADVVPIEPVQGSFMAGLRTLSGGMVDFDLPSESEWEYACRAGNGEGYWGNGVMMVQDDNNSVPGRYLLNQENTEIKMSGENPPADHGNITISNATAIVGSYPKNKFGLYDMHGNVWEWCIDMQKEDVGSANGKPIMKSVEADNESVTGGGTRRKHALRGGSWTDKSGALRSAYRLFATYNKTLATYGFRVKCTTGAK